MTPFVFLVTFELKMGQTKAAEELITACRESEVKVSHPRHDSYSTDISNFRPHQRNVKSGYDIMCDVMCVCVVVSNLLDARDFTGLGSG